MKLDTAHGLFRTSFNRTIVELKCGILTSGIEKTHTFNRTIVELK